MPLGPGSRQHRTGWALRYGFHRLRQEMTAFWIFNLNHPQIRIAIPRPANIVISTCLIRASAASGQVDEPPNAVQTCSRNEDFRPAAKVCNFDHNITTRFITCVQNKSARPPKQSPADQSLDPKSGWQAIIKHGLSFHLSCLWLRRGQGHRDLRSLTWCSSYGCLPTMHIGQQFHHRQAQTGACPSFGIAALLEWPSNIR